MNTILSAVEATGDVKNTVFDLWDLWPILLMVGAISTVIYLFRRASKSEMRYHEEKLDEFEADISGWLLKEYSHKASEHEIYTIGEGMPCEIELNGEKVIVRMVNLTDGGRTLVLDTPVEKTPAKELV